MIEIDYKKIPKIELHLHLDGSVPLNILSDYEGIDAKDEAVAPDKCINLADYLTKFALPVNYLQTKEHIKRACLDLSNNLEQDGVIYAEVRFAPNKLVNEGLSLDEVMETILEGFSLGNVPINLILCMMRNDSFTENIKVIELANKYLNKGVCALDLAGDEEHYPTEDFKELFDIAKEKNIPYTIHSGEVNSKSSLESALDFNTPRLGHGIQSINYEDILKRIKDNNVLLEVCPTSNVQTNVVSSYEEHPIKKLDDAGILISVSTDNRTVSNITLSEEYMKLNKYFGFTIEDFCKWNINAINHSFTSDKEKDRLLKIILEYINKSAL